MLRPLGYAGQAGGDMNTLILNRESYELPSDGWYQIAPLGEFPHAPSGVVQVVDAAACVSMVNRFDEESQAENFAGLLIDFDHFSLDQASKSEAAGWITGLENRESGLWAKIRWSDLGEDAVKGGRYRFLSPVWTRADCEDLGNDRVRPVRLLNAAVTNDPNLKGMVPLSNRAESGEGSRKKAQEAQNFKWTLGDSPGGRHCPSCAALAGQVHTMDEWNAAGLTPGSAVLYCGGHCHCSLAETDEPETGDIGGTPVREPDEVETRNARGWLIEAKKVLRNRRRIPSPQSSPPWGEEAARGVVAAEKRRCRALACSDPCSPGGYDATNR